MSNSSICQVYHSDIVETPQHCLTSAPRLNPLGKLSLKFGTNRTLIRTSLSPAPLFCLVKLSLRVKRMILSLIKCTMGAFLTLDSHQISSAIFFIFCGLKDVIIDDLCHLRASSKILNQAWTLIVEVDMVTWHGMASHVIGIDSPGIPPSKLSLIFLSDLIGAT